jgi:hypothetical protein
MPVFIQVFCHVVGDFFLQSDWQANNKYKHKLVALFHAILYTVPFLVAKLLLSTGSWISLIVICLTHAIIDHYKLANYVGWAKNWIGFERPQPWYLCKATGYNADRPVWLTVWLSIITDNTIHLTINYLALKYL